METEIKEVLSVQDLAMFIGCEMITPVGKGILEEVSLLTRPIWIDLYDKSVTARAFRLEHVKPILRTFDQMTDEEKIEFGKIHDRLWITGIPMLGYTVAQDLQCHPKKIVWLTRQGFDVFGWIDQDLAIEKED